MSDETTIIAHATFSVSDDGTVKRGRRLPDGAWHMTVTKPTERRWDVVEETTHDAWLEMVGADGVVSENDGPERPIYDRHVVVKWDGCVHYRTYSNGYEHGHECGENCRCCSDYIHVCDIDDFIAELQEIKARAVAFFKGKSGEEFWSE